MSQTSDRVQLGYVEVNPHSIDAVVEHQHEVALLHRSGEWITVRHSRWIEPGRVRAALAAARDATTPLTAVSMAPNAAGGPE